MTVRATVLQTRVGARHSVFCARRVSPTVAIYRFPYRVFYCYYYYYYYSDVHIPFPRAHAYAHKFTTTPPKTKPYMYAFYRAGVGFPAPKNPSTRDTFLSREARRRPRIE